MADDVKPSWIKTRSARRDAPSLRKCRTYANDGDPLTLFAQGEGKGSRLRPRANVCRVPVPVGASLGASFVHAPLTERDWWILGTSAKYNSARGYSSGERENLPRNRLDRPRATSSRSDSEFDRAGFLLCSPVNLAFHLDPYDLFALLEAHGVYQN